MELVDSSSSPPPSSVDGSPGELSLDELGQRIIDHSRRLAATTCRWLVLVADFDAREGYLSFGLASSAQWLTHACGIAHRTAAEHVRVARSLRHYPRLAEEMGAGRLSFSQVRAISRIAEPGEYGLVEDLIVARHGSVAQLEVMVRGLRTVDHNEQATDLGEYLKQSWTSDSRWQLSARLDPERGAVVAAAIDAIVQRDGCSPAQALEHLAEISLASLADTDNPPRELRVTNVQPSSFMWTPHRCRHVQLNAAPMTRRTRVQLNATRATRAMRRSPRGLTRGLRVGPGFPTGWCND
jgi:Domain of unknown function (DUF222)